jgi:hypothetical protein
VGRTWVRKLGVRASGEGEGDPRRSAKKRGPEAEMSSPKKRDQGEEGARKSGNHNRNGFGCHGEEFGLSFSCPVSLG